MKKFIKKITDKFKKVSSSKKLVATLLLVALAFPAVAVAVWGPARPSFDYNDPVGRQGSLTGPVFNSMKNTPTYGDEFNFTTGRKVGQASWDNDVKVQDGDEVEIRVYIHNNANTATNDSGLGVALNTKVGLDVPLNQFGVANEPIGFVNASNAKPIEVWDGTKFSTADGKKFKLEYMNGSASIYKRDGGTMVKSSLSDSVIGGQGTLVGSQPGGANDGKWLGCYEHIGWVIVKLKVVGEPEKEKPSFSIKKYVNGEDAQNNETSVRVKANEEFEYKVDVTNTGKVPLKNVKVTDKLPAGVSYVDNTLKLDGQTVGNDEDFFNEAKGIVVPSIAVGAKKTFTMKAVIKAETPEEEKELCEPGKQTFYNNVAKADPEGNEPELVPKEDPAVVDCTSPEDRPAVNIDKSVSKESVMVNEEFTYTIKVTNTGDIDLTNVKVDDPAPNAVAFVRSLPAEKVVVDVTPSKVTATIASLKIGESVTFQVVAKVNQYVPGTLINTACVDAPEVPGNPDDCDDAPVTPNKPNVPAEIPSTGTGTILTVLSSLMVGVGAFVASKRFSRG